MHFDCVIDKQLPYPAPTLLAHLTEPDLLTTWWPDGAETDPHAGGTYHLWWDGPGWHLRGRYLDLGPNRLVFSWKWDHDDIPEREVDIRLSEHGDVTHLALRHEAHSEEERTSYAEGWMHFLGRLEQVLDET